ncbi:MAG TPA: hypothetical protein VFL38_15750 [Humibacillus xanthopallidus]|nr:hypothetical protein [Humibacillus xanthopallidus]
MTVLGTPPDRDRTPSRGRRVVTALAVVALVVGVIGAASIAYRRAYGTWWQTPQRISFCDRTYIASPSPVLLTRAEVESRAGSLWAIKDVDRTLRVVATVPPLPVVGKPVLAVVAPPLARQDKGLPCAMALYLQMSADRYVTFQLAN